MNKLWLVAKHEYLMNLKRRSFLFASFGIPIFTIVLMAVVFTVVINNETDTTRLGMVGYVDEAGVLAQKIDEPAYFRAFDSEDAARAALDAGDVGAYFVLPADYMTTGTVNSVSKSDIPSALVQDLNTYLRANLGKQLSPETVERLKEPLTMSVESLDSGRIINDNAVGGLFIAPLIFVIIFMIGSQTTSGYLMSGVVEEKTSRIMEILVTSITPFQLLMGKILGLGALGLTQLVVWLIGGAITLKLGQNTDFLAGVYIPADLLILGLVYFLLGYFLLASVMAGVGAVVGSEQESRQFAGIFSLIQVIPFFLFSSFITDPNGGVVTFLTLFPLTAPISMILLMSFGTVPAWQVVLSLVLLFVTAIAFVWASARVFRWALLLYGKRPGLREVMRVIRSSPTMATTATGDRSA